MNQFPPQAPEYTIRALLNFFENSRRYLQQKVDHHNTQCIKQCHSQGPDVGQLMKSLENLVTLSVFLKKSLTNGLVKLSCVPPAHTSIVWSCEAFGARFSKPNKTVHRLAVTELELKQNPSQIRQLVMVTSRRVKNTILTCFFPWSIARTQISIRVIFEILNCTSNHYLATDLWLFTLILLVSLLTSNNEKLWQLKTVLVWEWKMRKFATKSIKNSLSAKPQPFLFFLNISYSRVFLNCYGSFSFVQSPNFLIFAKIFAYIS